MKQTLRILTSVFILTILSVCSPALQTATVTANQDFSLTICSFNIQFIGYSTRRDNNALATILKDFDIVVVQELVAPPFKGKFPDNTNFKPDKESAAFFNAMISFGFEYILSVEDTGTGEASHINRSATEWWVVFYKAEKVKIADDLPTGFLADDRTDHVHYERVPHAFAFRTLNNNLDFVLISVHLKPGRSNDNKKRRKEELNTIAEWVNDKDDKEKDFIILGDMNIEDYNELQDATPDGFYSLNDECEATNTSVKSPKPYDHVMYRPAFTKEIDKKFDFKVINLIDVMRPFWDSNDSYPGGTKNQIGLSEYDHDRFRAFYSDHHPVVFKLNVLQTDDD